uniref:Uncharacterized protein n=1 Tax=Anguilla anguilla TaxID=7936 RepID=A0A0E9WAH2_ANGAN
MGSLLFSDVRQTVHQFCLNDQMFCMYSHHSIVLTT